MPVNSFVDHPLQWAPAREALGGGPVYLALAAQLEDDIRSSALAPGMKLPPQRELADFLDLDFTTVTRAYNVCRDKGLIYGVTGRGTFVAAQDASGGAGAALDCGVVQGFPEIGANEIVDAARDVLSRSSSPGLFSYRNRDGSAFSRSAGVAWLRRSGVCVDASQVAVSPGSQGAISAALLSLFRVGDAMATDEFTYANLISLARIAHLRLVPVAADAGGMIPSALEEAAARHRIKGVFLMPYCANPTGLTMSERRKDALAKTIRDNGILIVEDAAGVDCPKKGARTFFARLPSQTVYISGTTRYIVPGLRVAFMAFPGGFAAALLDALHHLSIKASALDEEILGEVIMSGRAERILQAKLERARAANRMFDGIFPSAPSAPDSALFRMLPMPGTSGRGREVERHFRDQGVLVCHSDRFSVRPGNARSFLRVSLSSTPSPGSLHRALRRVLAGMSGFRLTSAHGENIPGRAQRR